MGSKCTTMCQDDTDKKVEAIMKRLAEERSTHGNRGASVVYTEEMRNEMKYKDNK
jgi:hypothetical protein